MKFRFKIIGNYFDYINVFNKLKWIVELLVKSMEWKWMLLLELHN
jgi:hypothetical protein